MFTQAYIKIDNVSEQRESVLVKCKALVKLSQEEKKCQLVFKQIVTSRLKKTVGNIKRRFETVLTEKGISPFLYTATM